MNKLKPQIPTNPLIFFITIIFFFLIHHSFSIDPWYESCIPMDCGDGVNITYPFFINGLQNPSCGYPGFNLTCINNNPVLQISGNNFTVQRIDQKTQRIRLQNPKISSNSNKFDHCPLKISNLTLDPNRFTVDDETTTKLLVISNCSGGVSPELERYRIEGCGGRSEFVVAVGDRNLGEVVAGCGGGRVVVETPVEVGGGDGRRAVVDGGNYGEVGGRGFWMRWRAADCGGCERSGGRCGFNSSELQFVCFCTDRPHKVRCKPENSNRMLIIISVTIGFAVIFVLATSIFFIRRAYKIRDIKYADRSQELEDTNVYFGVSVFSYAELQDATNHFNSSRELGDGGFGTVYYGKLRDGRDVAVKRLYEHNYKRVQQFMNEVEILTRLRHINLVSLYGCTSRRSRELLLVYEYIPNGTVADHLHGDRAKQSPLMWRTRMKIAIETANALVYLHASEIIHRDVKTNNILLDNNYCVKVADFGLSRLLPSDVTHVSTAPQGTPGYVDPVYHQCYQLTDKSDVYSFGVVLIELISSMPAIDISRSREEIVLANMAINRIQKRALDELIDPFLVSNTDTEKMINSMAELAFRCLQFESESRPTMSEVLEVLKAIQGEESCDDIAEVIVGEPELPLASPENDSVRLLKGRITASPISMTAKWHSSSSGSITANAAVSS